MRLLGSISRATALNSPSPTASQRTDPAKSDVSAAGNAWSMSQDVCPLASRGMLAASKAQNAAIEAGDLVTIVTSGLQGAMTAIAGFVMVIFMALMLMLLAAVTYAQVIWAQVALSILIILGPIFIPFLVFEPLAFLFWGWFRAMLTYSFYAVIAGAVLRVFSAVGIAYVTTLGQANLDMSSFMQVGMWTLAVVPFFIAGMLASLKCGELASMLVSGGGAGGSGLMGMVSTAGMAAASGGTAAAAKVGAGGMK